MCFFFFFFSFFFNFHLLKEKEKNKRKRRIRTQRLARWSNGIKFIQRIFSVKRFALLWKYSLNKKNVFNMIVYLFTYLGWKLGPCLVFFFFVTQFSSLITHHSKIPCLFGTITHFSSLNIFHTIHGPHTYHPVQFFFFFFFLQYPNSPNLVKKKKK